MAKHPRVSATEVLVRQPQDTRPLRMQLARAAGGLSIDSVAAVRKWRGDYPSTPQASAEPAELELGTPSIAGTIVSIPCTGGTHGQYYYVEVDVVWSDGATQSFDGWLLVKDHDA